MFDWFSLSDAPILTPVELDATDLLRNDHDSLKELFDRFKKAADRRAKAKIAREAIAELKINAVVEEEIFYPAVRQRVPKDVMNEADEQHHVAHVLIAELEKMDGHGDHFDAKFNVLAENVRRHIKAEESELLPRAQNSGVDLVKLGRRMQHRKELLLASESGPKFHHRAGSSRPKKS
jgi:hemerythrin-like domain-containing protein